MAQLNLGDVGANDIGPPAAIEIIASSTLATFYGYVDTTVETNTIGESAVNLYFLSASSIMRNGTPRVWTDTLPYDIASDLLATYGLGLEMDKLPSPMANFAQSDESDWETLRNLAVRNGLSLTASGPIVKLKDVINTTRRAKGSSLTPRFRRPGSPSSTAAGWRPHSSRRWPPERLWEASGTGTTGSTRWGSPSRSPGASAPSRRVRGPS